MDTLNELYPLYPDNPHPHESDSNSDQESTPINNIRIRQIRNNFSNRHKILPYDLWCIKNSDDLWYFWCMCKEHLTFNTLPFFNKMTYEKFCKTCYHNS
jgi:hypothetical protein